MHHAHVVPNSDCASSRLFTARRPCSHRAVTRRYCSGAHFTLYSPDNLLFLSPVHIRYSPNAVLRLGPLEAWYPCKCDGILSASGRQVVGCARGYIVDHNLGVRRDCGSFVGCDTLVQPPVTVLEVPNCQVPIVHLYPVQRQRQAIFLHRQGNGFDFTTFRLQQFSIKVAVLLLL